MCQYKDARDDTLRLSVHDNSLIYLPVVDTAFVLDNSNVSVGEEERIIVEKIDGGSLKISDAIVWQKFLDIAAKE